ncbi:MAG: hypothetical protein ABI797_03800 [Chloroflexota bacterium]
MGSSPAGRANAALTCSSSVHAVALGILGEFRLDHLAVVYDHLVVDALDGLDALPLAPRAHAAFRFRGSPGSG